MSVIDETVAATGILILRMIEESGEMITKDMAMCLYTAVATDCGFFRYANTDSQTLHAAARLVSYGAEPPFHFGADSNDAVVQNYSSFPESWIH